MNIRIPHDGTKAQDRGASEAMVCNTSTYLHIYAYSYLYLSISVYIYISVSRILLFRRSFGRLLTASMQMLFCCKDLKKDEQGGIPDQIQESRLTYDSV